MRAEERAAQHIHGELTCPDQEAGSPPCDACTMLIADGDVAGTDQEVLFELPEAWRGAWVDMPEYQTRNLRPHTILKVQFRNAEDRREFLKLMGHHPERLQSIWFPKRKMLNMSVRRAPAVVVEPNRYPVYIISKGRWENPYTAQELDKLGIPYTLVIEPQELPGYSAAIDPAKILTLPFSNLGLGSIPARNWVWEHAKDMGAPRHWILDDNMHGFYRLTDNLKAKITTYNPFIPVEDFADRYQNVGLAGMNYDFFAERRAIKPPFYLNTRIYSCILIDTTMPYRWRGRYNEDTDLSLRVLKDGLCTVLFNAILVKKQQTMTMTGGNSDVLYQGDGRLEMARSLKEQHPDVVRIAWKWGRWQHHVNYSSFRRNPLVPRTVEPPEPEVLVLTEEPVAPPPPPVSRPRPRPAVQELLF